MCVSYRDVLRDMCRGSPDSQLVLLLPDGQAGVVTLHDKRCDLRMKEYGRGSGHIYLTGLSRSTANAVMGSCI